LPKLAVKQVVEAGQDWRVREGLSLIEAHDPATLRHVVRVSALAVHLALMEGYNESETPPLAMGAMLHDVGKIGVRIDIIHPTDVKTSKVDYTEASPDRRFAAIKVHPEIGYLLAWNMFRDEQDVVLRRLVPGLVLTHHCHNADRENYPTDETMSRMEDEGVLKKDDFLDAFLLDFGGILAISDVYEAITANRTYTHGIGFEDPAKVRQCLVDSHPKMGRRIEELMRLHLIRFPNNGWMGKA